MEYESIQYQIANSATLKLLRSDHTALIISFLHKEFKVKHQTSIPQSELEAKLENYLEDLQEIEPNAYPRSPKEYLKEWCEKELLQKRFESSDEAVFRLTPEMEKAIAWLEELHKPASFVGMESRFLEIFKVLKEIQDYSTTDVETRITQLEQERDRIQQEIDQIRETQTVQRYNPTQLQERFVLANQMTRQLIGDFRQVDQNFKALTNRVMEEQLQKNTSKGAIIGQILDADQALKDTDQGRSFYTFWRFLNSTEKRAELKILIENAYNLVELQTLTQEYKLLRRIVRHLFNAGEQIIKSNQRLTEKIRQMLDERNLQETRRISELMTDILHLLHKTNQKDFPEPDFWSLESDVKVNLVMARPLNSLEKTESVTFSLDFSDLPPVEMDEEQLREEMAELFQQFYVDEEELTRRIEEILEFSSPVTLPEMLELYPVTYGLSEVTAYVAIAAQCDRHVINHSIIDSIIIPSLDPEITIRLRLPHIIFHR